MTYQPHHRPPNLLVSHAPHQNLSLYHLFKLIP